MWGDKGPLTHAALCQRFTQHYVLFIKLVLLGLLSPEPPLKGLDEKTTLISATNQEVRGRKVEECVAGCFTPVPPTPLTLLTHPTSPTPTPAGPPLCSTKSSFAPVPLLPKLSVLPQIHRLAAPSLPLPLYLPSSPLLSSTAC